MQDILGERKTVLNTAPLKRGPVVYWMSRDQRVEDNWALIYAQKHALRQQAPLAVVFCLVPQFLNAAKRQYAFMLAGLREFHGRLQKLAIPFFLLTGEPAQNLPRFVREHSVSLLVTDFDPLRVKRQWKKEVAGKIDIPFSEVDAHNIVPCRVASPKQEFGARTIRGKIGKLLPFFLNDFPRPRKHPVPWTRDVPPIEWGKLPASLGTTAAGGDIDRIRPGEAEARKKLKAFIDEKLISYDIGRNDPTQDAQSDLSPYLHFGQLSAQKVALEVIKSGVAEHLQSSFLEELIVRRELSDNFCFYNPHYDSFEGFPAWAKETLNSHRRDRRPYLYTRDQFETAMTHDDLWNATQMEMVKTGKMHGYMRMYWAKKILEWTAAPEEAMDIAIYLNDRYELDGRDPNGFTGIAWSIGGVHDRAWNERNVFGKIRYMSYNGCKSKFNVNKYIEQTASLGNTQDRPERK